jgi:hypothetical protein
VARFPCGCQHRLERDRRGNWIAVCDCGQCDAVRLNDADVVTFEPDIPKLAEKVAKLCGWAVVRASKIAVNTWMMGSIEQERRAVVLWLGAEEVQLRTVIDRLVLGGVAPFVLLTLTGGSLSQHVDAFLKREGSVAVALSDLVTLDERGTVSLAGSPKQIVAELEARSATVRETGKLLRSIHNKMDGVRAPSPASKPRLLFQKAGSSWSVVFNGSPAFTVPDTFGAKYLDYVLHRPGKVFDALELEMAIRPEKRESRLKNSVQTPMDRKACRTVNHELRELEDDLEHASAEDNKVAVKRLEDEIRTLKAAAGKQSGISADTGERARNNVRKAINAVVRRLRKGEKHEREFGRHIGDAVKLGYDIQYVLSPGETWE